MNRVWIDFIEGEYPADPPFHPSELYPESPSPCRSASPNPVYELLRRLFAQAGWDAERFGSPQWNPLGRIIQPGQTVVLKPNFVSHRNQSGDDLFAVVTHPAVLRAVADYVYVALQGRGRIIIADAPQMDCLWSRLWDQLWLSSLVDHYRAQHDFNLEILDLRPFELINPDKIAYSNNRRRLSGDPLGSVFINLGPMSAFYGLPADRFYGADYDRKETIAHHNGDRHEYCVSKTILSADVLISLPKLKTHKKVGVTLNLKGLVGINTNKNCLIHYRVGTPSEGGDQLPDHVASSDKPLIRVQRKLFDLLLAQQTRWGDIAYGTIRGIYRALIKPFRRVSSDTRLVDAGNWHGNDSAWRMTTDLARIIYFADREGRIHPTPQRKFLSVIDGIVAGEENGPLAPKAHKAGALLLAENLLAADLAATRLMGFDPLKIKQFSILNDEADFGVRRLSDLEIFVRGEPIPADIFFSPMWNCPIRPFKPHPGWEGHVELEPRRIPIGSSP